MCVWPPLSQWGMPLLLLVVVVVVVVVVGPREHSRTGSRRPPPPVFCLCSTLGVPVVVAVVEVEVGSVP